VKVSIVLPTEGESVQRLTPRHNTPTHQAPVMTVNVGGRSRTPSPEPHGLLILLEEDANKQGSNRTCTLPSSERLSNKPPAPPIFFRYVVFCVKYLLRLQKELSIKLIMQNSTTRWQHCSE
jgi:hypothetical protein